MDEEIRELQSQVAQTRYQFVKTELDTCFTAAEIGKFELSAGNTAVAGREVAAVENGIRAIQPFVPKLPVEQRAAVEARLAELQALLDSLKAELALRAASAKRRVD
jgi:hypothetical protein